MKKTIGIVALSFCYNGFASAGIIEDLKDSGVRINLAAPKCEIKNIDEFQNLALIDYAYRELDGYKKSCSKNPQDDLNARGIGTDRFFGMRMYVEGAIAQCLADNNSRVAYNKFHQVSEMIPSKMGCSDEKYFNRLRSMTRFLTPR